MTIDGAIRIIEDRCMPTACDLYQRPEYCGEIKEALDMAIKVLKREEKYDEVLAEVNRMITENRLCFDKPDWVNLCKI